MPCEGSLNELKEKQRVYSFIITYISNVYEQLALELLARSLHIKQGLDWFSSAFLFLLPTCFMASRSALVDLYMKSLKKILLYTGIQREATR